MENTDNQATVVAAKTSPVMKIVRFAIIGVLLAVGGYFGINYLLYSMHHETTDNAQLASDVYQLIPQVSGRIKKSFVTDYQVVKMGDTLFIINPDDYDLRIQSAEAGVAAAEANLEVARRATGTTSSGLDVSSANISAAQAAYDKAQQDLVRGENLVKEDVITKQNFDGIQAAEKAARAQLESAKAQYNVTRNQVGTSSGQIKSAEAQVALQRAAVDNARLTLSYTAVIAPADGRLSETKIKEGQYVQAGQPITSLIGRQLWVIANFKETQLGGLKIGQTASINVDAYPKNEFSGQIAMVSPATGAKFSLLPPDNATGNFVKVVQRVPVKITFTQDIPADFNLESGMNVSVSIPTE